VSHELCDLDAKVSAEMKREKEEMKREKEEMKREKESTRKREREREGWGVFV